MGRKKQQDDYDSFEDDDDDLGGHMAGLKLATKDEGQQPNQVDAQTYSRFPPPAKLWPYDYITGPWKNHLVFNGVGDKRIKSFLSEDCLVNGSPNGGVETRWSEGSNHEFWEAVVEASGQKGIFFSSDSIDELCNMLAEQCDQTPKSVLKPDPEKSLRVNKVIEPGSLKPLRPKTVKELLKIVDETKGTFFSLIYAQSKSAWEAINSKGGAAIAIRTQRYEADPKVVLEIGWAKLGFKISRQGEFQEDEDSRHFVVQEHLAYKNGQRIPNNRDRFGFGKTENLPEAQILQKLQDAIAEANAYGPLMLVFHDASFELEYLSQETDISAWFTSFPSQLHSLGLPETEKKKNPKKQAHFPIIIQDTQRLFAAQAQDPHYAQVGLKIACEKQGIETRKMNNAGNDAYYVLQLYDGLLQAQPARLY